jgi:RluA family pseudouridine synthase
MGSGAVNARPVSERPVLNRKPYRNKQSRRFQAPLQVSIVFEDRHILVVEKPAGLLTIATSREKQRTLYARLFDYVKSKRQPEKLFVVHRLDREASGLLVFAKSEEAKRQLQQQFKQHEATRTYLAVAENRIVHDQSTIRSYLAENAIHHCYSTAQRSQGKLAITHVDVVKRSSKRTLVKVRLETGRKHQIRVHLAEQGHPIVGDKVYGGTSNPLRRLALHAANLRFKHPRTNKAMEFSSDPPPSFFALV